MAIQVPSFLIPFADTPKPDHSWLDTLSQAGGDVIGELGMRKSMNKLGNAMTTGTSAPAPVGQPQGSFLSNLIGGNRQQAPAAPVAPVSRGAVPNQPPIPGIQRQTGPMDGYRNAIASIESAGSGDYAAVGPRHPKLGRALGRYQVMEANIGPWSQEVLGRTVTPEEFMANPQLQDAIFDGKFGQYVQKFGPEGAAQAWFGGEGGVGQLNRRDSLGTSIAAYSNKFNNALGASGGSVDAVNAMGAGGQIPGYVDPMVSAPNSRQQAAAPMPQGMPVNQMADASGNVLAPAVTPIQRGSISPDTIRSFLQDPNLREIGVELWKQNVQGPQAGEPWQFVTLPDGTLARANQQTGSVERIGNFAKPAEPKSLINLGDGRLFDPNNREVIDAGGNRKKAPQIVELFDDQTGQPYKARWNEETGQFDRVGGVKAPSGTQLSVGPDGQVTMTQGPLGKGEKFTEGQSKDNVFATRAQGALGTADAYADNLASYGNALLDNDPTGVARGALQNPDYQVARAAADEFLQAILRKDTGAAITEQEQVLYGRTYFPVPGDGPDVRAYKQSARRRALAAIEAGMSPAQMVAKERALARSQGINLDAPASNAPASAPAVGAVEDGYRFKGGDPSNPSSWEQVN